jgi:hypothetical protein
MHKPSQTSFCSFQLSHTVTACTGLFRSLCPTPFPPAQHSHLHHPAATTSCKADCSSQSLMHPPPLPTADPRGHAGLHPPPAPDPPARPAVRDGPCPHLHPRHLQGQRQAGRQGEGGGQGAAHCGGCRWCVGGKGGRVVLAHCWSLRLAQLPSVDKHPPAAWVCCNMQKCKLQ